MRAASRAASAAHLIELRDRAEPFIRASSAAFILKQHGGKSSRPRRLSANDAAIRGSRPRPSAHRVLHQACDDARFGPVDLIHQQQGVDAARYLADTAWRARRWSSGGVGDQFFESSRFSSRGGRPGSMTSGLQYTGVRRAVVVRKCSRFTPAKAARACRSS